MDITAWANAIEEAGNRLAEAAQTAGPLAEVPTCPGWRVRELLLHTGGVHRWATEFVRGRTVPLELAEAHDIADDVPTDSELPEWFRVGCATLVASVRSAPHDLRCWTFLRATSPLAHWARRQAHETTVHRVDAESAGDKVGPVEPALATDGIDELLGCFAVRSRRMRLEAPHTLHVSAADTGSDWTVLISDERPVVRRGMPDGTADTTLRGTAQELYLALWNRAPLRPLHVAGDATVVEAWPRLLHVRWN
ncbi:uncharacterized protein (TIGR03083 family) [Saccharomonospora amisosensis]|uniref:Uncharacterized protein (TIGR03083 family) n=1 Tax=Saccharomonospora amisosensis TaxID=1128677 RepID=A0A7X5ZRH8_9PSEU|nr:maleylpyruvate isomerase family mycothiol-dependent enzyme [Saccharomonospora amisosensis]NIJ12863.1 uncharacterized protein (TIGR03083 family) [Saccharomonospora amisosensis]